MIKYSVNYQPLAIGASRPSDDGVAVKIEATSEEGFVLLPNIGDMVSIQTPDAKHLTFSGKVRSRLFSYVNIQSGETFCHVNIVVEEMPDNEEWGKLIKE